MKTKNILWHWKQFDLAAPLQEILHRSGNDITLTGLVTTDSSATPAEQQNSFLGVARVSKLRKKFYSQSFQHLKKQYASTALELEFYTGSLTDFLHGQGEDNQIVVVWYHPQFSSEERIFLNTVQANLKQDIIFRELRANTLISIAELPFDLVDLPRTFSSFRRKIEKRPYAKYNFARYPELERHISPGRDRLWDYIFNKKLILTYKQTRNGLGQGDFSSRLSKWLSSGCLQAAEIGAAILRFERQVKRNESTYWLLFELLWRDYFHYLHQNIGTLLFAPQGIKRKPSPGLVDSVEWHFPHSNAQMQYNYEDSSTITGLWHSFRRWALASTGDDFIDTIMKELFLTGEISNRARQCTASFLIHDLHVPWWWGAQWFEHLLLDYDVSSNWGNWAYIAGVGADPREVRRFNITKQAQTYDPNGAYRRWGQEQQNLIPENALPEKFPGVFT